MRNALPLLVVVAACSGGGEPVLPTTTTRFDARPVVVFDDPELDDVLVVSDARRGVAIAVDGDEVTRAEPSTGVEPPGMRVPSPDGSLVAAIDEEALTVGDRRHPMEGVGTPAWLTWSPEGDALYFLDLDPDSRRARRVVGVPIGGAPATVVRFGPATSFDALAVE